MEGGGRHKICIHNMTRDGSGDSPPSGQAARVQTVDGGLGPLWAASSSCPALACLSRAWQSAYAVCIVGCIHICGCPSCCQSGLGCLGPAIQLYALRTRRATCIHPSPMTPSHPRPPAPAPAPPLAHHPRLSCHVPARGPLSTASGRANHCSAAWTCERVNIRLTPTAHGRRSQ